MKKILIIILISIISISMDLKSDVNNNPAIKHFLFNDQMITINIEFEHPTKVVFPAYIEKLEYLEGVGGIIISKKEFSKGQQSILITKTLDVMKDSIAYVTVLGKKIPLYLKSVGKSEGDSLVYIDMKMKNKEKTEKKEEKIHYKPIKYKELTRNTNLKSVSMIVNMIKGNADEYYKKIDLHPEKEKNKSSFFSFGKDDEKYSTILFKKLFSGDTEFFTSYKMNEIEPLELYEDNYMVYFSDKSKSKLNIYGMKLKWCNLNKYKSKQINIDDIKSVIGKNILAAKHPMSKIPPNKCSYTYVVFYKK